MLPHCFTYNEFKSNLTRISEHNTKWNNINERNECIYYAFRFNDIEKLCNILNGKTQIEILLSDYGYLSSLFRNID